MTITITIPIAIYHYYILLFELVSLEGVTLQGLFQSMCCVLLPMLWICGECMCPGYAEERQLRVVMPSKSVIRNLDP